METAQIYSNASSYLSWSSSSSVTAISKNASTVVTNLSNATVYWWEGTTNNGSLVHNQSMVCAQGSATRIWEFSEQASRGAARVTLTVTGSGGGGG
jgi:hypothetical protein